MRQFTHNGKPYSFAKVAANYRRLAPRVPRELGTVAVNYFKDSFRRQGWRDKSLERWKPRKPGAKRNTGRAILVDKGHLRNSIILSKADAKSAVISAPVPYAAAHNEGFSGTVRVRAHTRQMSRKVSVTMSGIKSRKVRSRSMQVADGIVHVKAHSRSMNLPKRQFLGDSDVMFRKMDAVIIKAIDQIFNA